MTAGCLTTEKGRLCGCRSEERHARTSLAAHAFAAAKHIADLGAADR